MANLTKVRRLITLNAVMGVLENLLLVLAWAVIYYISPLVLPLAVIILFITLSAVPVVWQAYKFYQARILNYYQKERFGLLVSSFLKLAIMVMAVLLPLHAVLVTLIGALLMCVILRLAFRFTENTSNKEQQMSVVWALFLHIGAFVVVMIYSFTCLLLATFVVGMSLYFVSLTAFCLLLMSCMSEGMLFSATKRVLDSEQPGNESGDSLNLLVIMPLRTVTSDTETVINGETRFLPTIKPAFNAYKEQTGREALTNYSTPAIAFH